MKLNSIITLAYVRVLTRVSFRDLTAPNISQIFSVAVASQFSVGCTVLIFALRFIPIHIRKVTHFYYIYF
jgi:hypothetical protein